MVVDQVGNVEDKAACSCPCVFYCSFILSRVTLCLFFFCAIYPAQDTPVQMDVDKDSFQ